MQEAKVGIIGGSGLYQLEGLTKVREVRIKTPFGDPSDAFTLGHLEGVNVAFLPRHGVGHRIMPTELPSRANIYGFKSLGVEYIIAISTVGSLKEKIRPTDIVIPDQIIDRSTLRPNTFFGNGIVGHIAFADPYCSALSDVLYDAAHKTGARVHDGGICIVMEGPQFSTRAESELYRSWGADVILMTALPEAKLAREAEICYATMALVTDYDVWHETEDDVSVESVVAVLRQNVRTARLILREAVRMIPPARTCACGHALRDAIITARERIPAEVKRDLAPIVGKYLGGK